MQFASLQVQVVLFITDDFPRWRRHCCLFDHGREFKTENPSREGRDWRGLHATSMRNRSNCQGDCFFVSQGRGVTDAVHFEEDNNPHNQISKSIADFVIPGELRRTISRNDNTGDSSFLSYDSYSEEPNKVSFIIFSSFSVRQRALLACEVFADRTGMTMSNIFPSLYSFQTILNNISYPIIFDLLSNERKQTFTRVFACIKSYIIRFDMICVMYVGCQLAAIHALRKCFIAE